LTQDLKLLMLIHIS